MKLLKYISIFLISVLFLAFVGCGQVKDNGNKKETQQNISETQDNTIEPQTETRTEKQTESQTESESDVNANTKLDYVAPVITLKGSANVTIKLGEKYNEPGYEATDNLEGDVTTKVVVSDNIKSEPGVYEVVYSVSDSYNNKATIKRKVTVKDETVSNKNNGKTIYLTFDDGPGPETERLLGILKKYNVKATFFVVNSKYNHLLKKIVEDGHAIGVHTKTHSYKEIYKSEDAFFSDLYGMQDIIYQNTGVKTYLMRFPGGSSNLVSKQCNEGIMTRLTKQVQEKGFVYFDWNVSSGDGNGKIETEKVLENVFKGIENKQVSVVLQHDSVSKSVDAVETIIKKCLEEGYTFDVLTMEGPVMHHKVCN